MRKSHGEGDQALLGCRIMLGGGGMARLINACCVNMRLCIQRPSTNVIIKPGRALSVACNPRAVMAGDRSRAEAHCLRACL